MSPLDPRFVAFHKKHPYERFLDQEDFFSKQKHKVKVGGLKPFPRLKLFTPELVTTLFPEKDLRQHPDQINHGLCMINHGLCMRWAYMAYLLFENVELYSSYVHAFVKYNGLFYDSEMLDGVFDSSKLPANARRNAKELKTYTERKFRQDWWDGNYIKPNWFWYVELARI